MVQREALFIVDLDEIPQSTPLESLRRLPGVLSIALREAADAGTETSGVASPMVRLAIGLRDDASLAGVITSLAGAGAHLREITKSEPTLEEVFVQLVGRGIAESDEESRP